MSQPTLSMQLKKLEELLGITLFERNNKQVLITPEGKVLVKQARVILHEIKEFMLTAEMARNPKGGKLSLGIIPTVAPYLLQHSMPALRDALPEVEFYLAEEKTEYCLRKIHNGDLDAIIIALPAPLEKLQHLELYQEKFVLAVPDVHALASHDKVSLKDLHDESLLLLQDGHCLRDQALEVCQLQSVIEKEDLRATSLETLRHMVAAGSGITLLPELATNAPDNVSGLRYIPFTAPQPSRTIAICWRQHSPRHVVCEIVAHTIRKVITPYLQ